MVILTVDKQKVKIDAGELVGYLVDSYEYIHQKGSPGWRNSDTEMFPIIGPTADTDFKVKTPKGIAVQDQHGLLRELPFELVEQSEDKVIFQKRYTADTRIRNSKYPEKSTVDSLFWPYDFQFLKIFHLKKDGLHISFKISGEQGMPFMLGYHPAFKLHTKNAIIATKDKKISIPEIIAVGNRAMKIPNSDSISLNDIKKLTIKTEGFGSFMLWTEVPNMICIEPITFYPYAVGQHDLNKGFTYLHDDNNNFIVQLLPN